MTDLAPDQVVASFDSASVLHAATAAALRGQPFPNLGSSRAAGAAVRAAGRLPWPLLRHLYTRVGASEGIDPGRLGDIDMTTVAAALAGEYPRRRYPAILIGASNGALTHLAAATQTPWLPGTLLIPVAHHSDPDRPIDAIRFGQQVAPPLLARNDDIVLHHMHDQVQDELMVARMSYFRVKWRRLPAPYAAFLDQALAPDAPVILVEDSSTWPVVQIADRHLFQSGAQGGLDPAGYTTRAHTPRPDTLAPEAEWGTDPDLRDAVAHWCHDTGHPLVRVRYHGPQAPAHAVATVMRGWYTARHEHHDRLLVSSFVLLEPWRTITAASVPYWTFFSVHPALEALDAHLAQSSRYTDVHVTPFQHGVDSAGIARPADWEAVIRRHGAIPHLEPLDTDRFPHDIGLLGRYSRAIEQLPRARQPWSPLPVDAALQGLRAAGLDISTIPTDTGGSS